MPTGHSRPFIHTLEDVEAKEHEGVLFDVSDVSQRVTVCLVLSNLVGLPEFSENNVLVCHQSGGTFLSVTNFKGVC